MSESITMLSFIRDTGRNGGGPAVVPWIYPDV